MYCYSFAVLLIFIIYINVLSRDCLAWKKQLPEKGKIQDDSGAILSGHSKTNWGNKAKVCIADSNAWLLKMTQRNLYSFRVSSTQFQLSKWDDTLVSGNRTLKLIKNRGNKVYDNPLFGATHYMIGHIYYLEKNDLKKAKHHLDLVQKVMPDDTQVKDLLNTVNSRIQESESISKKVENITREATDMRGSYDKIPQMVAELVFGKRSIVADPIGFIGGIIGTAKGVVTSVFNFHRHKNSSSSSP